MKRIFGSIKKMLAGNRPSPPEIKSRPHPKDIPDWMQQDSHPSTTRASAELHVLKHRNPNLRSIQLKTPRPTCRGNQNGTEPPKHPLGVLLKIENLSSFYCNKNILVVSKRSHASWDSVLVKVQSALQRLDIE